MATHSNQQEKHWYNDGELFRQGFIQSNYITSITDWFMSLAGKATVLVLYFTVLYSCIQLYPKVNLPEGLSLAVFIIQMGALDIGGLSLGTLARQARKDGHPIEATQAAWLSKALIAIMLLGVVTVSIGHVVTIEAHWFAAIQIIQVIARSIGAVLYGRVVHDLKHETTSTMVPLVDMVVRVTETEQRLTLLFTERLNTQEQAFTRHLEMLAQRMEEREQNMTSSLSQFRMETRQQSETISQQVSDTEIRTSELFAQGVQMLTIHLENLLTERLASQQVSQQNEQEIPEETVSPVNMISVATVNTKRRVKTPRKAATRKQNELASRRVRKAIEMFPNATQEFIAQKAGVSRSYVCKIASEVAKETPGENEEEVAKQMLT